MSARKVPELFEIDERIAFEAWLGRFRKQVSWQGQGIVIHWKSGDVYAPPGSLVSKSRRGVAAISNFTPTSPQRGQQ